jgi:hypothetical protein
MSNILEAAVTYIAATTRWSSDADSMHMRGTLWYGIMCRSFLLLERMLRLSLLEVSDVASTQVKAALRSRAGGKPLSEITLGQCVGVLEELGPSLPGLLVEACPHLRIALILLPESDRNAWKRILILRNRMAHDGPGFFDSVDFRAGRMWRKYDIDEPLDHQAKEVWTLGRQLCRSPFILTCIALQGVDESVSLAQLESAERSEFSLAETAPEMVEAIEAFHSRYSG